VVDADGFRELQRELRGAEAKYRTLVEQAPVIVYEWEFGDPGRWRYVSPRIETLLGYTAEDCMADPDMWFDRIVEEDRDAVLASEAKSQTAAQGERIEYRVRHRDGHVVWVRDEAVVVPDDGVPYFRGILSDVTLQKEAEQALESLNRELERRVQTRTVELQKANEELAIAKEELERASAAKSELLSRTSHELRTPLNAILGFGQLLEMSELRDEDRESLSHILKAGRHLLRLVDRVLDINRVEAGELALSLESVRVKDVVARAAASVKLEADSHGVSLDVLTSTEALVVADRERLVDVLSHVLSNAVRADPRDGRVSIDWSAEDDRTSIRVTDTGLGVAPRHLPGLFTPFTAAVAGQRAEHHATGLSLALSKSLVEAMGGTISATSEVGRGTTVSLDLRSSNPSR